MEAQYQLEKQFLVNYATQTLISGFNCNLLDKLE